MERVERVEHVKDNCSFFIDAVLCPCWFFKHVILFIITIFFMSEEGLVLYSSWKTTESKSTFVAF